MEICAPLKEIVSKPNKISLTEQIFINSLTAMLSFGIPPVAL